MIGRRFFFFFCLCAFFVVCQLRPSDLDGDRRRERRELSRDLWWGISPLSFLALSSVEVNDNDDDHERDDDGSA